MDKWFQSKWFVRVISLILAVSMYLFVTMETDKTADDSQIIPGATNEVQVLENVPLEVRIDSDQYVVSGVPEVVTVTLEGKTSILTPIARQQNFTVFVDLRDLEEGEHEVEVEHENIPEGLTAYIEPKTITVNIEKRATKEFKVEVEFVNMDKFPVGYELGTPEVNPETVTIVSSESIIEQIALVKVFVDVADLTQSITNREVPISVYDIQGNVLNVRVEPQSVNVSVLVEKPGKTVPLNVKTTGELPEGLTIDEITAPEEIEIFGKRAILNEINEISTKEIDLSKISESGELEVEVDFPEGVTADQEKVKVNIQLTEEKVIEEVSIDTVGQTNHNITFVRPDNPTLNVIAIGHDQLIKKLKKDEINASINVSNLNEGEHQVSLSVSGPNNIKLEPEFNQVTILLE